MNMAYNNNDFDDIRPYKQGVAVVKKGDYYGAIMVGGKQILPPIYESLTDFENGYATAKYYGDERVVNLSGQVQVKKGKEQLFLPETYDWGFDFVEDICVITKDGKLGIINSEFKEIHPPLYDKFLGIQNGYLLFCSLFEGRETKCIVDIKGNLLYTNVRKLNDLYYKVSLPSQNAHFGVINHNLEIIVPCEYVQISLLKDKFFYCYDSCGEFEEGCIRTLSGHKVFDFSYIDYITIEENWLVCRSRSSSSTNIYDLQGKEILKLGHLESFKSLKHINNNFIEIISSNYSSRDNSYVLSNIGVKLPKCNYFTLNSDPDHIYCQTQSLFRFDVEGKCYLILFNNGRNANISEAGRNEIVNITGKEVSCEFLNYSFFTLNDRFLSLHHKGLCGICDKEGNIILSPQYSTLVHWKNDLFIASVPFIEEGKSVKSYKYGIIDQTGKTILPFDYAFLEVLIPATFLCFSYDTIQYVSQGLNTNSRDSRKIGLIDSDLNIILEPKYNQIEKLDSIDLFKVAVSDKWGLIDYSADEIVPVKYNNIKISSNVITVSILAPTSKSSSLRNKNFFSGFLSNTIGEKGDFIVGDAKGGQISIPSLAYDWCGNFSEYGYAIVLKNGIYGKIDDCGNLVSLNGDRLIKVPDKYSWALDFIYGYTPIQIGGFWGIADENFNIVIPCTYDYIEPYCPGFFMVKNCKENTYGLVDTNNHVIAEAKYKSIIIRDDYFQLDNTIINKKGEEVLPFPIIEYELIKIENEVFWIYQSQYGGYGVYCNDKTIISPIYKTIAYKNGKFLCTLASMHKDYTPYTCDTVFDKYEFVINTNGEIILNIHGRELSIPSEFDLAFDAGYGLIKVKRHGEWDLLNYKQKIVTEKQYAYISDFNGIYAIVGVGDAPSHVCHKSDERVLSDKIRLGLINILGEEVLTPKYRSLVFFDNGYICFREDGPCGLMSPALNIIVPPQYYSIKMIDNYHFVVNETGLIDINGNIIIEPNRYSRRYKISVLTDGYYKLTWEENGFYETLIINANGEDIPIDNKNIKDLTMLENGLILVTRMYYNDAKPWYSLMSLHGDEILHGCLEMKFKENGLISIRRDDGWGLGDILGNIILECKYGNELMFQDSKCKIEVRDSSYIQEAHDDGRIFVKNGNEKILLPSYYYWGTDYNRGISIVRLKKSYRSMGVIDIRGNVVVPSRYESIQMFSNNIIITKQGDYYGAYDINGNMVLPQIFLSIEFVSENMMWVKWNTNKADSWNCKDYVPGENDSEYINYDLYLNPREQSRNRSALCSLEGHVISDPNIPFVGKFVGNYARIYKEILVEDDIIKFKGVGVIDIEGKNILKPIYNAVRLFKDSSYAEIVLDKKIGIADLSNHKIIMLNELNVKHIWDIDRFGRCLFSDKTCKYDSDTHEWYDGNYGVLNTSGVIMKAGKYDYIELLDNGLMLVSQNIGGANLYGILDIDGKEIIPTKYTDISSFYGENAVICIGGERSYGKINNGKWGVINSKGEFVKECVYDSEEDIKPFVDFGLIVEDTISSNKNIPEVVLSDFIHDNIRSIDYDYSYDYDDSFNDGSSKYGGYNGYDDDTIDEAFDGNPELTWNID